MQKRPSSDRGLYRRRGSPHWWIRYAGPNGRIVRESTGTTSKRLAREILSKKKVLVAEGKHLDVKRIPRTTFHQLCSQYWKLWGRHKRMHGLSNMIEAYKTAFGDVPLKDLTQTRIELFLHEKMERDGASPATRNRYLTILKAMFNKAIEWGLAVTNPAEKIGRLREDGHRMRFLDQDEIELLLECSSAGFRPIVVTALHTGMRRGEILDLEWESVDLKRRLITVERSKSGKKRTIPIDDTLRAALRDLPSRFARGYVFPSPVDSSEPLVEIKRQIPERLPEGGARGRPLPRSAPHLRQPPGDE